MKEQKEKTKPTKKRVLVYYLVLAASLLIIAAITVGVIFAVRANRSNDFTLDDDTANVGSGGNDDDGGKKPDDGKNDDDNKPDDDGKDKPTDSSGEAYIAPVDAVTLSNSYVFSYNETCDHYRLHQGMDFAANAGTEVKATADGKIVGIVTEHQLYGGYITIEHANGVQSIYKYIVPTDGLALGATVKQGQRIATVAEAIGSEIMNGDHLHFEIKVNGRLADPDTYLNIISK